MSQEKNNALVIILILGSLCTLSPFATDMYLPAFPVLAAALHTSTAKVALSMSSYFAGLAAGQLVYGPLLDRFGRKLPLYAGLILFSVACLLCLPANTIQWLVMIRFIQALGACAAQVAAMAMVRDFFPVHETARIISLLILILGVSPLLAPTVGGFVAAHFGWQWIFIILAAVSMINLALCHWFLPNGLPADPAVSLRLGPVCRNFIKVLKNPQFFTYSLSGSFAFSGLLVYVAGSPILFMEVFHVSTRVFGMIFAGLAVGFIGSNQVNVLLLRKFSSEQIFLFSLVATCPLALFFLVGAFCGWFGLWSTLVLLFIILSVLGLGFPNAAALSMAPLEENIGSASALLGFLQIGISGLASASIGFFDSHSMMPVVLVLAVTSWIALLILWIGKRRIPSLRFVEEKGAAPVMH